MDRIQRWSGRLRRVAQVLFWMVVLGGPAVLTGILFLRHSTDPMVEGPVLDLLNSHFNVENRQTQLDEWGGKVDFAPFPNPDVPVAWWLLRFVKDIDMIGATLAEIAVIGLLLHAIVELMRLYEAGLVFRETDARWVRRIGILLAVYLLMPNIGWDDQTLEIHIDPITMLMAAFVWLLGWVMDEARKHREELDAVV